MRGLVQAAQSEMMVAPRISRHSYEAAPAAENAHSGVASLPGVGGAESIDGALGAVESST